MANALPPFTEHTARLKVKAAQAAWNTRDPNVCVKAYSPASVWRNRSTFLRGHDAIVAFLAAKWQRELDYRLRKELFAFTGNKIAVQFWYEYRDASEASRGVTAWKRVYGLEDWTFDAQGKMEKRMMSANEVDLGEGEDRWFRGEIGDGGEGKGPGEGVNRLVDAVEIGDEHW